MCYDFNCKPNYKVGDFWRLEWHLVAIDIRNIWQTCSLLIDFSLTTVRRRPAVEVFNTSFLGVFWRGSPSDMIIYGHGRFSWRSSPSANEAGSKSNPFVGIFAFPANSRVVR